MPRSRSQPTPEVPLTFPRSLSRYQPIAQIARGGMAEVILVEMSVGRGLTKLAVLKRIWPELATDREFVAMFLREARLSAGMNHPNIVQTFEVLGDGPRPAISMEYLAGQSLTRVLNRLVGSNALSWTLRLRILSHVLAALDYAHELTNLDGVTDGVVHRDVNPQNVFITYSGRVKLIDFGVAKSLSGPYQTRPGAVKGKLAYMAPEQLRGQRVDRRADLFAVGVMLWEMAAGRRLWLGMTEATIMRHLSARVPIRPIPLSNGMPHGLTSICSRAVALDPEKRYATAAEFAADLERLIPGSDESHGRHLGKLVSLAFAEEHAARDALIASHHRRARPIVGAGGAPQDMSSEVEIVSVSRATPGAMWTQDPSSVSDDDSGDEDNAELTMGIPTEPSGSLTVRVVNESPVRDFLRARSSRLAWGALGFAVALLLVVVLPAVVSRIGARAPAAAENGTAARQNAPALGVAAEPGQPARAGYRLPTAAQRAAQQIVVAPMAPPTRADEPSIGSYASGPPTPVIGDRAEGPRVSRGGSARGRGDREELDRLWKWLQRSQSRPPERTPTVPSAAAREPDDNILEPSIDLQPEDAARKSPAARATKTRASDVGDPFDP